MPGWQPGQISIFGKRIANYGVKRLLVNPPLYVTTNNVSFVSKEEN
jgi:hypothetical protein